MDGLSSNMDLITSELRKLGVEAFDYAGPCSEEVIEGAERELGLRFPNSYRAFLRCYGSGSIEGYTIFGLPRDRVWGDVVMLNQLATQPNPERYLRFVEDVREHTYCLDTIQMNKDGECPVVVFGPDAAGKIVASSFLAFLQRIKEGLI